VECAKGKKWKVSRIFQRKGAKAQRNAKKYKNKEKQKNCICSSLYFSLRLCVFALKNAGVIKNKV
jgi:hypothetical protein